MAPLTEVVLTSSAPLQGALGLYCSRSSVRANGPLPACKSPYGGVVTYSHSKCLVSTYYVPVAMLSSPRSLAHFVLTASPEGGPQNPRDYVTCSERQSWA